MFNSTNFDVVSEDMYKDFLIKEEMVKVMIFKDLYHRFQKENEDNPQGLAAGVLMIFINQNLSDLTSKIDHNIIIAEANKVLDEEKELKCMVLTYLRTKFFFQFALENNKHSFPMDGPTRDLFMKYGLDVPAIKNYQDFFLKFEEFSKTRQ